jgi:hypothetical protein
MENKRNPTCKVLSPTSPDNRYHRSIINERNSSDIHKYYFSASFRMRETFECSQATI